MPLRPTPAPVLARSGQKRGIIEAAVESAFQLYAAQDQEVLFSSLRALSDALTAGVGREGAGIDPDGLEFLWDHMVIVRPGPRFGDFRFEFCGPAWIRMARCGDVSGLAFADLLSDRSRLELAGYLHVARLKLPHVTRNVTYAQGKSRLYTRLLMPQIRDGLVISIIGAALFHDAPIEPAPATRAKAELRRSADILPFQ